jgi:hypothetical protein
VETAQTRMLRQVDTMMESLQEKTGSWLQGEWTCADATANRAPAS